MAGFQRHGNSCAVRIEGKTAGADFTEITKHARRENAQRINSVEPEFMRHDDLVQKGVDYTDIRAVHEWGMARAGHPRKRRGRGEWIEIDQSAIPSGAKIAKARWNGKRLKFKYTAENGMIRFNEKTKKYEKYEALPVERSDLLHCLLSVSPELMRDKDGKNKIKCREERALIQLAVGFMVDVFGEESFLLARYDRDEVGIGVVDVFMLPLHKRKRGSSEEVELNQFAAIEAWRKRRGFPVPVNPETGKPIVYGSKKYASFLGELIQEEWFKQCRRLFPNIERGKSKNLTKRKYESVSKFKNSQEAVRIENEIRKEYEHLIRSDLKEKSENQNFIIEEKELVIKELVEQIYELSGKHFDLQQEIERRKDQAVRKARQSLEQRGNSGPGFSS